MRPYLFEYNDYKGFVRDVLKTYPEQGRGMRRKIAEAAGCQVPYVSHVLSGDYDFSAEQAEGLARLLGLTASEKEYFLHLVLYQRAGTPGLRAFYKATLERLAEQHSNLRDRLKTKDSLDQNARAIYYSSWHYAAIHMLPTIPGFQTPEKIRERLNIQESKVEDVIEFLLAHGLLEKKQNRLHAKLLDLHLERGSPLLAKHHTNWRLQAIQSLDQENTNELHYSLAFTASEADLPKIRKVLTEALQSAAAIIRPSAEEDLMALCVDFFRVAL